jgi:hypothetical protein
MTGPRHRSPAEDGVPASLRVAAALAWRILVVAAFLLVLGLAVARLRLVVVPSFIALLLAAFLTPPTNGVFERHQTGQNQRSRDEEISGPCKRPRPRQLVVTEIPVETPHASCFGFGEAVPLLEDVVARLHAFDVAGISGGVAGLGRGELAHTQISRRALLHPDRPRRLGVAAIGIVQARCSRHLHNTPQR